MSKSSDKPALACVEAPESSVLEGPVNMNICEGTATERVIQCSEEQDEGPV